MKGTQNHELQRHSTYVECQDKDDERKTYRRPWHTSVFCRHQVAPVEAKEQ